MQLFLDDDPNRAALAYQRMTPEDQEKTIWCKTAEEAIITLRDYKHQLTKVMLDHDLGGEKYVNVKREDSGMEIVRWLERQAKNEAAFRPFLSVEFIVHSYNSYAGPKMVERMRKLGLLSFYIPFGT